MKVIETEYAGYRFRSRLEARWAVFFDHADIPWDYEPQGYVVSTQDGDLPYLPDFWLPSLGQYAEVKGYLDRQSLRRLVMLASGLSGCGQEGKADLVVFGAVPRRGSARWVTQLHWEPEPGAGTEGSLYAFPWETDRWCPLLDRPFTKRITSDLLCEGNIAGIPDWAEEPLDAARSARFEWGESG